MDGSKLSACLMMLGVVFSSAVLAAAAPPDKKSDDSGKMDGAKFEPFKSESSTTAGNVTVNGQAITYQAVTGTLVVHPKDWDDVPRPRPRIGTQSPRCWAGAGVAGDIYTRRLDRHRHYMNTTASAMAGW